MASKQERLNEFLRRLVSAEATSSAENAFNLVCDVLNGVEDELTDIPFDPDLWMDDGRMYPPQQDSAFDVDGHPDVTRYRSRLHNTFVSSWGAIEVRSIQGEVLASKPSADGRSVWD